MSNNKSTLVKRNYTVLDAFKFFFFLMITFFVASFAFEIIVSIIEASANVDKGTYMNSELVQIISCVLSPTIFIVFFLVYNAINKISYRDAFSDGQKVSLLPISVAIVLAIISIFLFTPFMNLIDYWFAQGGYMPDDSIPLEDKMKASGGYFALDLLIYALLPAIAEEIIFRGVIQRSISSKFNGFVAVFFSTLMFVLVHGSLQQTVYQLIVGIMLGYLACVGGNIVYSIILHFLSNALVLVTGCFDIVQYLSSDYTYYYNVFSMIFPICLFLLGLVLVGILFWVLKYLRNKNFFRYEPKKKKKVRVKKEELEKMQKFGFKDFWKQTTYNEKVFALVGIIFVGILWLVGTISGFM